MATPEHITLPTVAPRERSLVVHVQESTFAARPDILPVENTRYEDCDKELFAGDYKPQFFDYVYKEQYGESGMLFVKTKTVLERNTQIKATEAIKRPVPWHSVLEWIEFVQDRGAPLSQNTADGAGKQGTVIIPRWLVRRGFIHGQTLMTQIIIREFLSEVPWPDELVPSDEPVPTEVPWELAGSHGSTGPCLHRKQAVPPQSGPYAVIGNDGNPQSGNSTGQKGSQIIPRTNHLKWVDFTTNEVQKVLGQYHRIERTYIAPIMPKASVLEN